jgi:hypothetical protein
MAKLVLVGNVAPCQHCEDEQQKLTMNQLCKSEGPIGASSTLPELVLSFDANHYGTLVGPNALTLLGKQAFHGSASGSW